MTMLIVTHEMQFARDISSRVAFMHNGVILEEGTPQDIFERPASPQTADFLKRFSIADIKWQKRITTMTLVKDYKQIWYDIIYYLSGSLCYSIGIYSFAKDAGFAPGGFSGIALICNHLWNLPIGTMTLLFNIPAILISYNVLGRASCSNRL